MTRAGRGTAASTRAVDADPTPVIEVRGLTHRFGERVALAGLDLSVGRGEVFGCLGPNGSGKSTLMRIVLGLLRPSAGDVRVLGSAIPKGIERLRPRIGYMPQRFSLYDELSVRENLEFAAEAFGIARRRRHERIADQLAESGLDRFERTRAGALSGGWKQRLSLAAATVHDPELLILDEPTAGVDPQSRRDFWAGLFELAANGTTIFVSTHYMDEAIRCHRLCILSEGHRVALGTPRELVARLADRILDVEAEAPEAAMRLLESSERTVSVTQLGDLLHVLIAPGPPIAESVADVARELERAGIRARVEPGQGELEDLFVDILHDRRERR